MDIQVKDSDIVSLILEYLHSRQLFESALALEKETGLKTKHQESLPEDILFLRQLTLAGKWDTLLSYLEPFTHLDDFNSNGMYYTVLKQQYYEALQQNVSGDGPNNAKEQGKLRLLLNSVRPYCNKKEFNELCQNRSQTEKHNWSVASSRMTCFNDLLTLMSPLYDEIDFFSMSPTYKNNDLVNALAQAMIYNECIRQCIVKGKDNKNTTMENVYVNLSTDVLMNDSTPTPSASLYYWIKSLQNKDTFNQSFKEGRTRIKLVPLHPAINSARSLQGHSENFKMSSFVLDDHDDNTKSRSVKSSNLSPLNSFHAEPLNSNNNNSLQTSVVSPKSSFNKSSVVQPRQSINNSIDPANEIKSSITVTNSNVMHDESSNVEPEVKLNGLVSTNVHNSKEIASSIQTVPLSIHQDQQNFTEDVENIPFPVNLQSSVSVKDSYSDFLKEKEALRKQKDKLLKDIEIKSKVREDLKNDVVLNDVHNDTHDIGNQDLVLLPTAPQIKYVALESLKDSLAIRAVSFHPSGMVYAIGSNTKTLRICAVQQSIISNRAIDIGQDLPSPTQVLSEIPRIHKGSIYCVDWNEGGTLLLSGSNDKSVKIHSYDVLSREFTDASIEMTFHKGIVRDATFLSGQDNLFASAGGDGNVYIGDCSACKIRHELSGHADHILSLYSWNSNLLVSSSQDKTIRLWDLRASRCTSIIGVSSTEANIPLSVCVNQEGSLLAMGQDNGIVGLYDLTAGKLAHRFRAHSHEIRSVRFNTYRNSNRLLSGSYDGNVSVIDIDKCVKFSLDSKDAVNVVASINDKVIQCRWHPNGRDFATTSAGKLCTYYYQCKQ